MYALSTIIRDKDNNTCRIPGENYKILNTVNKGTTILNKLNARVYQFKDDIKELSFERAIDSKETLCTESKYIKYDANKKLKINCCITNEDKTNIHQESFFPLKFSALIVHDIFFCIIVFLTYFTMDVKHSKDPASKYGGKKFNKIIRNSYFLYKRGEIVFILLAIYTLFFNIAFFLRFDHLNQKLDCDSDDTDTNAFQDDNWLFGLAIMFILSILFQIIIIIEFFR